MHQMVCPCCGRLTTRLYGGGENDPEAECWNCIEPPEEDAEAHFFRTKFPQE